MASCTTLRRLGCCRPRADRRRRRVRDDAASSTATPFARASPPRAAATLGRRARAGHAASDAELRPAIARGRRGHRRRTDGRLRVTVTGGVGPLGSDRGSTAATGHRRRSRTPTAWPPTRDVVTVPWRRNEHSALAGLKTTSYAENVVALRHAPRSEAPTRRSSPTPPASCARARARTSSSCSAGGCSRRRCRRAAWPASPRELVIEHCGVDRGDAAHRRLADGRRGASSRRARATCSRSPSIDGRRSRARSRHPRRPPAFARPDRARPRPLTSSSQGMLRPPERQVARGRAGRRWRRRRR